MGVCTKGIKCLTCGGDYSLCPGHFGHIELNQPVIHPFFQEEVVKCMNTFCYFCHKLVLSPSMLGIAGKKMFNSVHQKCCKAEQCARCRKRKPEFYEDDNKIFGHYGDKKSSILIPVKGILEHFKRLDAQELSFLHIKNPSRFIITVLPVMPPQDRPFVQVSDKEYNDDLTTKYCTIVKINSLLSLSRQISSKTNRTNDQVNRLKISDSLDFHVRTLMTNSRNLAKQKNNKPTKAIGDRLGGKNGIMRGRLMGKRVNQSARTVAGPDPTLDVDEVGIPQEVAKELTVQQRVCPSNIEYLTKLLEEGKINSFTKDNGRKIFSNMKTRRDPRNLLIFGDRIIRGEKIINPFEIEHFGGWPNYPMEVSSGGRMITIAPRGKFKLIGGDKILRGGENLISTKEYVVGEDKIIARGRSSSYTIVKDGKVLPGDLVITGARIIDPVFPKNNTPKLTAEGDCVVSRQLKNGDYILLNRQPTIHEFNIMAHRVKILPGKTVRINLAICNPYNCDFDGSFLIAVNRKT
jgi:DNA-directed RNA polymerase beta' subunit